jgi:hypothetical protein
MSKFTIFSWGYWGWGNATPQLVRLVDSVEAARGFNPPVFVDIRISRSVRARGFRDNAFGDLIGRVRYRHMPSIGNLSILGQAGPAIQIKEPSSSRVLLDLACKLAESRQRLLFFCSCEYPRLEGDVTACHRVTVARLLLEAVQVSMLFEVVEWPGGEPRTLELEVSPSIAKKLLQGARSIPLGGAIPHADLASLAWGSVVRLRSELTEFPVVVGPPKYGPQGWFLPLPWDTAKRDAIVSELVHKAREWRHMSGFEPRYAGG